MRLLLTAAAAGALLVAAGSVQAQTAPDPHAGHAGHAGVVASEQPSAGVQTSPADGWMGSTAPTVFIATFPHEMRMTDLTLKSGETPAVEVDLPAGNPAMTVRVPLPTIAKGNHVLTWSAQGVDGHVMNGVVRFMVH